MFKRSDIGVNNSKNLKLSGNVIPNSVSSVEEDLRILDRILDDIENIGDDNYVDTMLDCGNKKKESHSNSKNSTHLKRNVGKVEEVQKLVVEKKLTATEQVRIIIYIYLLISESSHFNSFRFGHYVPPPSPSSDYS